MIEKTKVSVKVMNSYDYSHFEVCLSTDEPIGLFDANELRKKAQRLVDESIRQYRKHKQMANDKQAMEYEKQSLSEQVAKIRQKPESEWNESDKAKVKQLQDEAYWHRFDYDYQDDFED